VTTEIGPAASPAAGTVAEWFFISEWELDPELRVNMGKNCTEMRVSAIKNNPEKDSAKCLERSWKMLCFNSAFLTRAS
jgi:hypothetical protein